MRRDLAMDKHWMKQALLLAEKGRAAVSPNPVVGAVLVRNGRLVGQGWHKRFGGPHAEAAAIRAAGVRARGATLYVTLEPCCTWGKTPPCTEALVRAGVREVVVAAVDPNPQHAGRGIRFLRKAGLKVRTGVLAREAGSQNAAFFKWIQTGLPYVTLKMAQTLDGKIATRTGQSRWISSPASRRWVHRLRGEHDAVLVGKNTLFLDDPQLMGMDRNGKGLKPWRVALDPLAEISPKARLFDGAQPVFLAVSEKSLGRIRGKKWPRPVTLLPVPERKGRLDLTAVLKKLAALGVAKLLVEGGGETAWSFLSGGHVDRVIWIMAPKFFGGRSAKTSVEGDGVALPARALPLKEWRSYACGQDLVVEGRF